MIHLVRTTFRDYSSSYGGDKWAVLLTPSLQGLGQGNGSALSIREIVSTPLLNRISDVGYRASFKWLLSGETLKLVGYCFVDDSTIIPVAPSTKYNTEEIIIMAQKGLDIFSGAAQATGRKVTRRKNGISWNLCGMNQGNGI